MSDDYKKQAILDSLYHHCQTRTYTSKDVVDKLVKDLVANPSDAQLEQLLAVVRDYKNTGKNLEATIDVIYTVLYTTKW